MISNEETESSFLTSCIEMLRRPEDISELVTEAMCGTLAILEERINNSEDGINIMSKDISEVEYKKHFEELLKKHGAEHIGVEILKDIQNDCK